MTFAQSIFINIAGLGPFAAFWLFVLSEATARYKKPLVKTGIVLMAITLVSVAAVLLLRAIEAWRFPLSNLYESILWFVLFVCGGFLYVAYELNKDEIKEAIVERRLARSKPQRNGLSDSERARNQDRRRTNNSPASGYIGQIAALLVGAMLLYGSWLPAAQHEIKPLVPALVSYWRQIHVPPLICSYALFFISGAVALLQLFSSGCVRSATLLIAALVLAGLAIALGTFTDIDTWILQAVYAGSAAVGVITAWLQLAHRSSKINASASVLYDDIGSRCISIGLPLLTFGIITGGLWANHAWGTYWSWDPKESMALTTWLAYAAYIHLRVHRELPAEKLSVVAVIGTLLTLLTYLGFNSLGFGGLHSYGRFK